MIVKNLKLNMAVTGQLLVITQVQKKEKQSILKLLAMEMLKH